MRSYCTRKTHKKQRGGFIDAVKGLFGFGASGETTSDLPEPMEGETKTEEESTNQESLPATPANMVGGRRYKKSRKSKKAIKSRRHKSSRRRRHH